MKNKMIKFEIKNFLGHEDVTLNFQQPENIYIGENGLGKTTILNIIFYTITLNHEELQKFNFEKIIVTMNNSESFFLLKEDIIISTLLQQRKTIDKINHKSRFNIDKNISERLIIENNNEKKLEIFLENNKEQISKLDLNSDNFKDKLEDISKFNNAIKKMTNDVDILYFPTFRRIEEDIVNIQGEELYIYQQFLKKQKISSKHGELIQFGMSDVEQVIKDLLEKIKELSINSFNEMTGVLLNQYVESNIRVDGPIEFNKMEIILNRIGDKINNSLRIKILNLIQTEEIFNEKNEYLLNLLVNLIDSYKKQEEIDIRIKKFVDVCNNYLVNKKYIYDESNVSLNVVNNRNDERISLKNLSSGEKQIISTFSKIYLEERKEFIILFDEPELSLSLPWQERYLPDIIASGKCNLLVAVTHSPFIFESSPLFDISEAISDSITHVNDYDGELK